MADINYPIANNDEFTQHKLDYVDLVTEVGKKADKLMATNLVKNGDFSQGTTGWGASYATLTSNDNIATLTFNGGEATVRLNQDRVYNLTDLFYTSLEVQSDYWNDNTLLNDRYGGSFTTLTSSYWERKSAVAVKSTTQLSIQASFNNYIDGTTNVNIRKVNVINLTATFGAGNEPTKEQMDMLLAEFPNSWFDGTQEILPFKVVPQLLDEKANKAQEGWLTPTLRDGWTGTVQYRKNSFGKVEFKGVLIGAEDIGSIAFNMPVGYRASYPIRQALALDATGGGLVSVTLSSSNHGFYPPVANRDQGFDMSGFSYYAEV